MCNLLVVTYLASLGVSALIAWLVSSFVVGGIKRVLVYKAKGLPLNPVDLTPVQVQGLPIIRGARSPYRASIQAAAVFSS